MSFRVGIDVGGTFTDFYVVRGSEEPRVFKTLSTPGDPSIGLVDGLGEIAGAFELSLDALVVEIDTIVHGTTVTTNATLTRDGARTGLVTTAGLRDALEMRRGIREEQYDNRFTNVAPLAPRHLRIGVAGRLDRDGREIEALDEEGLRAAAGELAREGVGAVAICFMNAFANPDHERRAAAIVRKALPDAYLTVSTDLLPSIRFYDRVSTTVLNSYVGPILSAYLDNLTGKLADIGFAGALLIMQSNGGVTAPAAARAEAAGTLLSGPAAGPGAGLVYAGVHGREDCITVDMGGTSFDAALVRGGEPLVVNEGEIDRLRIALPMLDINTIGAGGGSIGWIDAGGLLRMGPRSAGADPGPVCYGRGGTEPTCTDADLALGYLDPDYFAGGRIKLDAEAARRAIGDRIGGPMGMTVEQAAAGMFRVINNNMAQGVREITVRRGLDAREFPMVVAGGAGALHACAIATELEIAMFIVPRESSIFCAAAMLMVDLKHDYVRTHVTRLDAVDWTALNGIYDDLINDAAAALTNEGVTPDRHRMTARLDCRYARQYHEVSFTAPLDAIRAGDAETIAALFHAEHNRLYGYSLEDQAAPVQIINVRLQALGETDKPGALSEEFAGADASPALKGERRIYIPEPDEFRLAPVYDGHALRFGMRIAGPALIEQVNTAVFVSAAFDAAVDRAGSLAVYAKGRDELITTGMKETAR